MLIHKTSHGVLFEIATLNDNEDIEYRRNLRLEDFPNLNPSEWWELQDNSILGKMACRYYPEFDVVELDGQLCDIKHTIKEAVF